MTDTLQNARYPTPLMFIASFAILIGSLASIILFPAPSILTNLALIFFGSLLLQWLVFVMVACNTKQSVWGKFSIFVTCASILLSAVHSLFLVNSNAVIIWLLSTIVAIAMIINLILVYSLVNKHVFVIQKRYKFIQSLMAKKRQLQQEIHGLENDQQEQEADLEYSLGERNLELEIALRELSEKNRELEKLSAIDSLTGLMNRRFFDKRILAETRRSKREMTPLSVAILDIDHFKRINDTYGHLCGDHCLKEFAKLLQQEIKRPSDTISRYGGEEFVLILPNTDVNGVLSLIERVREKVEAMPIYFESHQFNMTVSIGACSRVVQDDSENISILGFIDTLLYEAKKTGRNKVIVKDFPNSNVEVLKY